MCFLTFFQPNVKRIRRHQVELSAVSIGNFSCLEYGAEQSTIICKKDGLDHIEITFGFDIVVVSNSSQAQRFIVLVNDTDHATPESFDGVFTLEFD